ncbi:hypothetical protein GCM10011575_21580 [Microlunatus endophyticus]|uniref:HTH marR-type domain-containing protein n=1 Tax=Microlunatus endophyticus TaxID=1716077 RepID=A0A917S9F2_9ACTN|nr:MarR family transcriptional regulator [Microlunatus endophyticus]GGL62767.1 hypothetical protein GCM10011575_21580 [Microlunatus endophyticus]
MQASSDARTADDSDDLIDLLAQSAFMTMRVLTKLAADNDLSLTQLRVLAILRDRRLQMSDLAGYLGLEKSTLTGLVSRAESRGLLQRAPNAADRRSVDVLLTDQGRLLARQLAADLTAQLKPLTEPLASADRDRLRHLLAKVNAPRVG